MLQNNSYIGIHGETSPRVPKFYKKLSIFKRKHYLYIDNILSTFRNYLKMYVLNDTVNLVDIVTWYDRSTFCDNVWVQLIVDPCQQFFYSIYNKLLF